MKDDIKICILASIVIMFFSSLDAFNTLLLLSLGATEANPVMDWALGKGVEFFFWFKTLLTFTCLLILTLTNSLKILAFIIALYVSLILYQAYIIGIIL